MEQIGKSRPDAGIVMSEVYEGQSRHTKSIFQRFLDWANEPFFIVPSNNPEEDRKTVQAYHDNIARRDELEYADKIVHNHLHIHTSNDKEFQEILKRAKHGY